ncbi:hypothetical protein EJB05_27485 [Eragrostis curvula]|uniref:F-box domain-containing protein n=1 Tax=Eragrostis curvula TaxID=38414 RepID=A0A5J9UP39_9POAL|nr:hypothetical protein EJB05_27485 [Eragrostis curvula]
MADGSEDARGKRAVQEAGADRLSALPDDLLQQLMTFLPSRSAVQTCVLARRWREQWKSVPAIRITREDAKRYWGPNALNRFVNCLLIFRNKLPLDEAELNSVEDPDDFEEAVRYLEPWVQYCLSREVRKLCVSSNDQELRWLMPKGLITSAFQKLTTLELSRVHSDHDLDFSGCVKLEDLKIEFSGIFGNKIFSPSLKRLSVKVCAFPESARYQICVPNLTSLLMVDCTGLTPLLQRMPMLVDAFVRLQHCDDCCQNKYEVGDCGDESCKGCRGINYGKSTCVILEALSGATMLELPAAPEVFILRRDLTRCPVFSKLKTLLLNEWCFTSHHGALICFLQHSPVLEKLILQFPLNPGSFVQMGARYNLKKQSLILKDLTVEVKCYKVDEWIHKVLEVLCSYGLPLEKVKIKRLPMLDEFQFCDSWGSGCFSFEQKT